MAEGGTSSPSFRRFWFGQAASQLGDAFGLVAMPQLVLETTHSVTGMGTVTAVAAVGQVIATPFAGVIVDRVHRRRLMIGCDLARLALYASLPLCAWSGTLKLGLIYVVALLTSVASNLFMVGYVAAIANLVESSEVARANGRLQATQALTYVVGSALGGAACARFGNAGAMGIDALSFAASATTLSLVRFRRDRAERATDVALNPLRELLQGFSFLTHERSLRAQTLFQTGVALLGSVGVSAAVIDVLIYRLKVDFHQSSSIVGTSLALSSVGAVVGAVAGGKLSKRVRFGVLCIAGTTLQGVGMLLGGFGANAVFTIVGGLFWSCGLTTRAVAGVSLRQTLTPDALLGRVVAVGWLVIFSASAAGAVLVTRLAAAAGSARAMACLGAALFAFSLAGAAVPALRQAGRAP
ncbi:MAG TPA: MFS transporter [Polyangiaceae bacterium]|nr:MFS transporter [Polyangiaceae bacterium]